MRAWFLVFALVACGDSDNPDTSADTTPGDDDTTTPTTLCDDEEPLTWDNFAEDFFATNCQTCHASDAADRNGAPELVTFDNEAQVLSWTSS